MKDSTWKTYYDKTKSAPPRPLLVKALPFVSEKNSALDLGAGALNDAQYLLSEGFEHVTALDSSPIAQEVADTLPPEHFLYVISTYENFDFKKEAYDLINAQYALPFNPPESFDRVFQDIITSLKPCGVFTGQLFGIRDEWNVPNSNKSFHTKEQVENIFSDLEILGFREEEGEKPTAAGPMKHWHVFHFIARKT